MWVVMDNQLNPYQRKDGVSTPTCSVWDENVSAQDDQETAICVGSIQNELNDFL